MSKDGVSKRDELDMQIERKMLIFSIVYYVLRREVNWFGEEDEWCDVY